MQQGGQSRLSPGAPERQPDRHGCSVAEFASYIDGAVVHLHDAIDDREPYAGAVGPSRIVQRKHALDILGSYSHSLVGPPDTQHVLLGLRADRNHAARRHRLTGVLDEVEQGLAEQLLVPLDGEQARRGVEDKPDALTLPLGLHQRHYAVQESRRLDWLQLELVGPHESEEPLDDTVEAPDLAADHLEALAYFLIRGIQALLDQLDVDHHGVERIFDLVGHAGSKAAEGRQPLRVAHQRLDGDVGALGDHGDTIGLELLPEALQLAG